MSLGTPLIIRWITSDTQPITANGTKKPKANISIATICSGFDLTYFVTAGINPLK